MFIVTLLTYEFKILIWFSVLITVDLQHFRLFMPLLKKEGQIALHMSISMTVSLPHCVQWITLEYFAPKVSNLVGR